MKVFSAILQQVVEKNCRKGLEEFGLIPHDQPAGPLVANLAANVADYAGFADCTGS